MPVGAGANGAGDEERHRGDEQAAEREYNEGGVGEVLDKVNGEEAADEGAAEADREGPDNVILSTHGGLMRRGGGDTVVLEAGMGGQQEGDTRVRGAWGRRRQEAYHGRVGGNRQADEERPPATVALALAG